MNTRRTIIVYLSTSVLLFLFQFIYHTYSHGVVSTGLAFAWLIPLVGGALVLLMNPFFKTLKNRLAFNLYNVALTLTVNYLLLQGILDIAGSDSPFLIYNLAISGLLLSLSLFLFLTHHTFANK